MNFKKDLSNVAAEVAKIMEAELSAKQKAIAKVSEPKHKIDAGDLAKLRAGHKPVKEEADQLDELSKETLSSYRDKVHGDIAKQFNKGDDNKLSKRLAGSAKASMRLAGVKPGSVKEEVVEEGIEDKIEAARKKAKAAGKKVEEPKKPAAPAKRKVEGKAYGGAKQKEEMEESVLPFTSMLEAYSERGLSAFIKEQVEVQQEELTEEVDNETFAKEVETNKKKNAGELRNEKGVAAAATQSVAVQKEEVEQIEYDSEMEEFITEEEFMQLDELSQVTLSKYFNKRRKKLNTKQDRKNLERSQHRMVAFDYGTDFDRKKAKGVLKTYAKKGADYRKEVSAAEKAHQANLKKIRQQHGAMKEEVEQVEERSLTEPEMKKKEEVVKSMKKNIKGFKERYGERAKSVMYATATRIAKEKK